VFNPPYLLIDGDNASAHHHTVDQLWHQGTEPHSIMEESQSFMIGVTFKIHTTNRVEVDSGMGKMNSPSKLTASKKKPPSQPTFAIIQGIKTLCPNSTLNPVIDCLAFKNKQVLDFRIFIYGKSLNSFKELVGNVCNNYYPRMKKVVLKSALAPLLTWNASVGLKKVQLFVQNLEKSQRSTK
ncbi:hypothetical protein DFH28DRAFT_880322, partial [Melampsora americana]